MILFFGKVTLLLLYRKKKLIHAYGPMKKVVIMNIDKPLKKFIKLQD